MRNPADARPGPLEPRPRFGPPAPPIPHTGNVSELRAGFHPARPRPRPGFENPRPRPYAPGPPLNPFPSCRTALLFRPRPFLSPTPLAAAGLFEVPRAWSSADTHRPLRSPAAESPRFPAPRAYDPPPHQPTFPCLRRHPRVSPPLRGRNRGSTLTSNGPGKHFSRRRAVEWWVTDGPRKVPALRPRPLRRQPRAADHLGAETHRPAALILDGKGAEIRERTRGDEGLAQRSNRDFFRPRQCQKKYSRPRPCFEARDEVVGPAGNRHQTQAGRSPYAPRARAPRRRPYPRRHHRGPPGRLRGPEGRGARSHLSPDAVAPAKLILEKFGRSFIRNRGGI